MNVSGSDHPGAAVGVTRAWMKLLDGRRDSDCKAVNKNVLDDRFGKDTLTRSIVKVRPLPVSILQRSVSRLSCP